MVTSDRIVIVGTTGSGKSTLAEKLALALKIRHIELDSLFWGPNWSKLDYDQLRVLVEKATVGQGWIVDGNYSRTRDIVWSRAETLVWLDYSLPLTLWRLWWRTLKRVFLSERLWNENAEHFTTQFFSRDSLFLWVLKTHPRHRRDYPSLLSQPEYSHLTVIHHRTPSETENWYHDITRLNRGLKPDFFETE